MVYQETSAAAFEEHKEKRKGAVDRKILEVLEYAGENGLTDQQIEHLTGFKHQTVSANRRHLVEAGLIENSGERRVVPPAKSAIVWRIAKPAKLVQKELF